MGWGRGLNAAFWPLSLVRNGLGTFAAPPAPSNPSKRLTGPVMRKSPMMCIGEKETQFCKLESPLLRKENGGNVLFMFSYSKKTHAQSTKNPESAQEAFRLNLSDLPNWFLEASCCYAKAAGLTWFLERCGDQKLGDFVCRLTCSHCGERPKYVHIQSAPYYRPGVAGDRRLTLIGSEETKWQRYAKVRSEAIETARSAT